MAEERGLYVFIGGMSRRDHDRVLDGRVRVKIEPGRVNRSRSRERDHERDRHRNRAEVEPGRASRSRSRERDHGRDRRREDTNRPLNPKPESARPSMNPSARETWVAKARELVRKVHPSFLSKPILSWEKQNDQSADSMSPPDAFTTLAATLCCVTNEVLPPAASSTATLRGHMSDGVRAWDVAWVREQLWLIIVSNVKRVNDEDNCPWGTWLYGPAPSY